jgi:hypothetical protein
MAGRDDDAGEPRGIEQAFFLVEIPAAVLLRHQRRCSRLASRVTTPCRPVSWLSR